MSKELPYFRFVVQEWQNGDISLEDYEMQGLFINICAYYWVKDCSATLAMLYKRFSNSKEVINQLIELDILKHETESDYIQINFLNEQFDILSEARKRRQQAGSKGGKQRSSNARAMVKLKDKDKERIRKGEDKERIPFEAFWDLYGKKNDRHKSEKKWDSFSNQDQKTIIDFIPRYKKLQPDPKFRKYPMSFFNNRPWEDELKGHGQKVNGDVIHFRDQNNHTVRTHPKEGFDEFVANSKIGGYIIEVVKKR